LFDEKPERGAKNRFYNAIIKQVKVSILKVAILRNWRSNKLTLNEKVLERTKNVLNCN
jgi:hypothetical protein